MSFNGFNDENFQIKRIKKQPALLTKEQEQAARILQLEQQLQQQIEAYEKQKEHYESVQQQHDQKKQTDLTTPKHADTQLHQKIAQQQNEIQDLKQQNQQYLDKIAKQQAIVQQAENEKVRTIENIENFYIKNYLHLRTTTNTNIQQAANFSHQLSALSMSLYNGTLTSQKAADKLSALNKEFVLSNKTHQSILDQICDTHVTNQKFLHFEQLDSNNENDHVLLQKLTVNNDENFENKNDDEDRFSHNNNNNENVNETRETIKDIPQYHVQPTITNINVPDTENDALYAKQLAQQLTQEDQDLQMLRKLLDNYVKNSGNKHFIPEVKQVQQQGINELNPLVNTLYTQVTGSNKPITYNGDMHNTLIQISLMKGINLKNKQNIQHTLSAIKPTGIFSIFNKNSDNNNSNNNKKQNSENIVNTNENNNTKKNSNNNNSNEVLNDDLTAVQNIPVQQVQRTNLSQNSFFSVQSNNNNVVNNNNNIISYPKLTKKNEQVGKTENNNTVKNLNNTFGV